MSRSKESAVRASMHASQERPLARIAPALTLVFLAAASSCSQPADPARTAPEEAVAAATALSLPESPKAALAALQSASAKGTVAVFKHSPICPISGAAHGRFQAWIQDEGAESKVAHAHIDVLAEKPLARGLVAELGIKHESPQILLFHEGELVWHASHEAITGEALNEQLDRL